jgi:glycosyltransferase involved in cell wall biosynthesis
MLTLDEQQRRTPRPRLLMTAYHYDRAHSMESRLSWQRAQHAASEFDVTVICARGDTHRPRDAEGQPVNDDPVDVLELPINRFERALMSGTATYYLGYRLWHRRVLRLAAEQHARRPFALVHHVSFCGYREPGCCWRLGVPFVWGPVGGTRPFPLRFLRELDFRGGVRELLRNVANDCQLRFARHWKRALRAAESVMAANEEVADDVARHGGVRPRVMLETGVGEVRRTPRPPRDPREPLKVLWSGRLRSWKGLPLLLRALAALPVDCRYTLRVLGQGMSQERWERLAERLGIDGNIEWAGWPGYREQLPHYDWADVFAFTSLRDTSGTGLLEALAAGAPIVGIDHQGVADVMSDNCAMRVPATSAAAATAGFRDAIARLAGDPHELARLSRGALLRAADYQWDRQWDVMREIYNQALATAPASEPQAARREAETAVAAMAGQGAYA